MVAKPTLTQLSPPKAPVDRPPPNSIHSLRPCVPAGQTHGSCGCFFRTPTVAPDLGRHSIFQISESSMGVTVDCISQHGWAKGPPHS